MRLGFAEYLCSNHEIEVFLVNTDVVFSLGTIDEIEFLSSEDQRIIRLAPSVLTGPWGNNNTSKISTPTTPLSIFGLRRLEQGGSICRRHSDA